MEEAEPLFTFDKEEWWDVVRYIDPNFSREEYDKMWADFVRWKMFKELH